MAKTTKKRPLVPDKKTIAAMREARADGLKRYRNLKELFQALDEEEDARAITVTRFEVIEDGKGRAFVRTDVAIELSYQDEDRRCRLSRNHHSVCTE